MSKPQSLKQKEGAMEANRFNFRVWLEEHQTMTRTYHVEDVPTADCDTNYILMQSTGLTDKNGVEIFEGDVVLKPTGTSNPIVIEHEGEKLTAYRKTPPVAVAVLWNRGKFVLHNTTNPKDCVGTVGHCGVLDTGQNRSPYELEVIGNIHQNPELLQERTA